MVFSSSIGRLEPAVRADEGAGLFAEPREDGVKHQREQHHERQPVRCARGLSVMIWISCSMPMM